MNKFILIAAVLVVVTALAMPAEAGNTCCGCEGQTSTCYVDDKEKCNRLGEKCKAIAKSLSTCPNECRVPVNAFGDEDMKDDKDEKPEKPSSGDDAGSGSSRPDPVHKK
eukprot:TRINITY_DN1416_c0_g1_i2.p1 TRINITY_DN1416_c0_g1~~TRINITY_DN1416_c0_g1_i2.p1  ORF type:complete len:109 (+),score=34.51 TRINITY_DN1416_c0_g1_i2:79-405(+)